VNHQVGGAVGLHFGNAQLFFDLLQTHDFIDVCFVRLNRMFVLSNHGITEKRKIDETSHKSGRYKIVKSKPDDAGLDASRGATNNFFQQLALLFANQRNCNNNKNSMSWNDFKKKSTLNNQTNQSDPSNQHEQYDQRGECTRRAVAETRS
jgi:hypothetical protein